MVLSESSRAVSIYERTAKFTTLACDGCPDSILSALLRQPLGDRVLRDAMARRRQRLALGWQACACWLGRGRTLRDRHRPSRACHSPAGARLILQDIGKPRCTEAGDETVDADPHFVAVADWRAESHQDSAVPD